MSIYKEAIVKRIRFNTPKGELSTEQLVSMSMYSVANVVKSLKKELGTKTDNDLAFLDESAPKTDPILQLKFDIAKDVYLTKKAEKEDLIESNSKKSELEKLLAIKARRSEEATEQLSDEELEKRIKELNS